MIRLNKLWMYIILLLIMDIYLAKLKEKPTPNIKQKEGLHVFFANTELVSPELDESLVERDETGEIVIDYNDDQQEKIEKKNYVCQVIDQRKKSKLDRDFVMKTLMEKNVLLVREKKDKQQTSELAETVEEPEIEKESYKEPIEFKLPKDVPKVEMEEKDSKKVVIKKRKALPMIEETYSKNINPNEEIDGEILQKRLPHKYEHRLKTSTFYMNNRKKFIDRLGPLFEQYKKEMDEGIVLKTDGFSPMIHQRVVSDYLNLYTPYRGLLLFHGLGAGKTCGSIGIAEGMKSQKKIFVLTLASLKANFFNQLKECGDPMYRMDQYWEFVSIEGKPDYIPILSNILNIPQQSIRKRKGAWLVNVTKESNFKDLNDQDKKILNDQLDEMIRSKYIDVNYNGLTDTNIDNKLRLPEGAFDKGKINPFDNSVVIIDEVHNFVSMIVNKMNNKKSRQYRLYEFLMSASNARVVLLSGTPIINYPNEIGILFNILRGYIKTWTFPITKKLGSERPTRENIVQWLEDEGLTQFDYVDYSGEKVVITRNPLGFINVNADKQKVGTRKKRTGGGFSDYRGVTLDETGKLSDSDFKKMVIKALKKHGLETEIPSKIKHIDYKALPDNSKDFLDKFVELDSSEMKNKGVFQKRILGLTSYFKGADDSLYPRYIPSDHDTIYDIQRVEMSGYQFNVYEKMREEESKLEKKQRQGQKQDADELFKTASTYKIASRLCCNFAFPDPPGRPKKNTGELIDKEDLVDFDYDDEPKKGRKKKTGGGESDSESETEENPKESRKVKVLGDVVLDDIDILNPQEEKDDIDLDAENLDEEEEEQEDPKEIPVTEIRKPPAKQNQNKDFSKRVDDVLMELETRKNEVFSPEGLKTYSPKFLRILENIQDRENTGLHLIYSQFRTLEGVSLLKYVLNANGYAEFKIRKITGTSDWEIDEDEESKGKPKYALHTGTESDEEKRIILNVYNSNWAEVPSSIVNKLEENGNVNNFMGECVRILMITASGAEGINLKNTRFVHIVEPYFFRND